MKKVLVGLSGIILVAFITLLFVNATSEDKKESKKATTEMTTDCSKCPSAAACADKTPACAKTAEAKPCAAAAKASCQGSTDAKKCDEPMPACCSKK